MGHYSTKRLLDELAADDGLQVVRHALTKRVSAGRGADEVMGDAHFGRYVPICVPPTNLNIQNKFNQIHNLYIGGESGTKRSHL